MAASFGFWTLTVVSEMMSLLGTSSLCCGVDDFSMLRYVDGCNLRDKNDLDGRLCTPRGSPNEG